jgi:hypothetical protein
MEGVIHAIRTHAGTSHKAQKGMDFSAHRRHPVATPCRPLLHAHRRARATPRRNWLMMS